jgi:hypothetical protein
MGLVSLLVYYKQTELLRINQSIMGTGDWEDAADTETYVCRAHAYAAQLGRMYAVLYLPYPYCN